MKVNNERSKYIPIAIIQQEVVTLLNLIYHYSNTLVLIRIPSKLLLMVVVKYASFHRYSRRQKKKVSIPYLRYIISIIKARFVR